MEYFVIFVLKLIGIVFQVWRKLKALDKKYPDVTFDEIFAKFFKRTENILSLILSGVILFANEFIHYVINYYSPEVHEWSATIPYTVIEIPYILFSFIIAAILGWAGQKIVYAALNKGEDWVMDKIENKQP
jgi:hypothetical protein